MHLENVNICFQHNKHVIIIDSTIHAVLLFIYPLHFLNIHFSTFLRIIFSSGLPIPWFSWILWWGAGDDFELWCWRRLLRVPWTARRCNQSIVKENQSWIFTGWTVAEAEAPILWPPDAKSQLIGKDPDAGKDWRQKENRSAEDEMVG